MRPDEMTAQDVEKYLQKYKFFCIEDDDNDEAPVWFSTLGLDRYGKGLEVELILPIEPILASQIVFLVAKDIIDGGRCYEDNELIYDILDGPVKIKVMNAYDDDSSLVYRIVISDSEGRYPDEEGCEYPYSIQENIRTTKVIL